MLGALARSAAILRYLRDERFCIACHLSGWRTQNLTKVSYAHLLFII